jgi:hypothetical protein
MAPGQRSLAKGSPISLQRAPRTAKKISFARNTTRSQVSAGEGVQPPASGSWMFLLSKITESREALDLSELVRETSGYQRKL